MEKQEILRKFLERGLQLDYQALDYFFKNQNKIDIFFQKISLEEKPTILSNEYILSILEEGEEDIEIIKKPEKTKTTLSIDDITKIVNKRYSFLKKILSSRLDLINPISLNKINPKLKHFSSIIMVKEKFDDERAILGEDETGEHKFFFENVKEFNQILLDDTVGVVCETSGRTVIKSVMWPDIQMKRNINKTSNEVNIAIIAHNFDATLAEKIQEKRSDLKYIIFVSDDGTITYSNKNKATINLPCMVKIQKAIAILFSDSKILAKYHEFKNNQQIFLISLLKRRCINPTFSFANESFENDPYLIDVVPDIFVVFGTESNNNNNYKGTTILTLSGFDIDQKFWTVNLKTRECINLRVE